MSLRLVDPPNKKAKRTYYYGIHGNGMKAVCTTWEDAQVQIKQITNETGRGPAYKKFYYKSDAEYFATWGCLPDPTASGLVAPNTLVVYTDGSSFMDTSGRRAAGCGVFFGSKHPLNIAAPFTADPLTNNRAELTAIRLALEALCDAKNVEHFPPVEIKPHVVLFTDSSYARDALGDWRKTWEKNNFKNNTILNRDVIEPIWALLDAFFGRTGRTLDIVWNKGHAGIGGNEAADALANAGARRGIEK